MIRLFVVVAVTLRPAAHPVQIRRIAVDQLPPFKGKPGQKPVCAPVDPLDRVVAAEALVRPCVQIDADVPERGWLALHDRAATQMRFDVDVVRRHHRDQRLAQPRCGLRSEPCHFFPLPSVPASTPGTTYRGVGLSRQGQRSGAAHHSHAHVARRSGAASERSATTLPTTPSPGNAPLTEQAPDGRLGRALIVEYYVADIRKILMCSRTLRTIRNIIRSAT